MKQEDRSRIVDSMLVDATIRIRNLDAKVNELKWKSIGEMFAMQDALGRHFIPSQPLHETVEEIVSKYDDALRRIDELENQAASLRCELDGKNPHE